MATLPILTYPDPKLEQPATEVVHFDPDLHQLLDDLYETMVAAGGIGLAATQVGRQHRAFVIDLGLQPGYKKERLEFINPRIVTSSGRISFEEGCLSVPRFSENVARKSQLTITYQDRHGNPKKMEATELMAVAIQHETDHLDGILFIDRLPAIKRHWVRRKLKNRVTL